MSELSTTEAKQAERAAASRGGNSAFDVGYEQGFMAGIEYTLKELLPSRCVGFAEWVGWNYDQSLSGDKWLERGKNPVRYFTTKQLLEKYITEYLKQQQDGRTSEGAI